MADSKQKVGKKLPKPYSYFPLFQFKTDSKAKNGLAKLECAFTNSSFNGARHRSDGLDDCQSGVGTPTAHEQSDLDWQNETAGLELGPLL